MSHVSADLAFALRLADAADQVSVAHFRSEEIRTTWKGDGTPVSQVDLAVEQAMLNLVRTHHPNDAVIGEEVGPHDGSTGRRWIFDGIDGTHNYSEGRPGWGTIIALEVDGDVALGLVTAPVYRKRWWAQTGAGAWSASHAPDATFDPATGTRMQCTSQTSLADATVIASPFTGFLLGWRNDVPKRFPPPPNRRAQCFALDGALVAAGELDAAIITLGGVWDFAATSLMVREAGGVYRNAWGDERLTTESGVLGNAELVDQVLDVLATMRPPTPDKAQLARTVSTAIGGDDEGAPPDGWRRFGLGSMPSMSARQHVVTAPPLVLDIVDERAADLAQPFVGVTTDGTVRPRSLDRRSAPASTKAITDAALAFLQALTTPQRDQATFAIDATEWRMWINVHMNHFRHGLMLEDLEQPVRDLALDIVKTTLSARGFHHARSIMRLNQLLAELTGDPEAFGEWPYFVSIFGTPGGNDPWGWQFDGHHLCLNVVVFEDRIVTTPTFMGAEPRRVHSGPFAGISLFDPEEAFGLELIRSFDADRRPGRSSTRRSTPTRFRPTCRTCSTGACRRGAFHDNLVAPYLGVSGAEMTVAQRRVLTSLTHTYVDWVDDDHARERRLEVDAHLDETWFCWYGRTDDESPFYYRVHSPVILIEFDHHPGVAFDNIEPTRHHVHTVVRTPNGGDYGSDLLRRHHERFDHSHGDHRPH